MSSKDCKITIVASSPENDPSSSAVTEGDRTLEVSPAQDVWDGKTIEVCGIKASTTGDTIVMFFQSKRRSGGDNVETMQRNTDHNVAHVTFKEPQGQCCSVAS